MRFFTMDWWLSCQDRKPDFTAIRAPWPAYRAHLALLRDKFPSQLVDLSESAVLHDGEFRQMLADWKSRTHVLSLTVDSSGEAREVELRYRELVSFRIVPWKGDSLSRTSGLGDVGYDEIDVAAEGDLLHRILFRCGTEIEIQFRQFELLG